MKIQISIFTIILLILLSSREIYCQYESNNNYDPVGIVILTDVVYITPAILTLLMVHESGHCSIAKVFGAKNARIGFYRKTAVKTQIGWADWDQGNINDFGTAASNISGSLFSRGLAECSDLFLKNVSIPNWGQRYFSMMFILSRFDMPRYIFQDAFLNFVDREGSDFDHFVTIIAGKRTGVRTLTYALLLSISIFDLVMDWDRITAHWNVLEGGDYQSLRSSKLSQIKISPYYNESSAGLNLQAIF